MSITILRYADENAMHSNDSTITPLEKFMRLKIPEL